VFAKEVAVVAAVSSASGRGRVKKGLGEIDLDEVPARPKRTSWPVRDKKKAIGREGKSSTKGSGSGGDRWGKRFVIETNRGSSSSGNRNRRLRKRRRW
jgi:hypothetical protein